MGERRQYKTPKLHLTPKERRIKEERKIRDANKAGLSQTEKILYVGLKRFAQDVLEATGRGQIVDEAKYARAIKRMMDSYAL